jgi:hypothetical protein
MIDASSISANFPFQADSLTLAAFPATEADREVTMSREGKFRSGRVDGGLSLRHSLETGRTRMAGHLTRRTGATQRQSERLGKRTGRRKTNDRKHRKATPNGYCCQSSGRSEEANRCSIGEACHSRGSKWENALAGLTGVKGDGMCGRVRLAKSGENLSGPGATWERIGIRNKAESRIDAGQEVGDGHSTEDPGTMKSLGEGRAISLRCFCRKEALA